MSVIRRVRLFCPVAVAMLVVVASPGRAWSQVAASSAEPVQGPASAVLCSVLELDLLAGAVQAGGPSCAQLGIICHAGCDIGTALLAETVVGALLFSITCNAICSASEESCRERQGSRLGTGNPGDTPSDPGQPGGTPGQPGGTPGEMADVVDRVRISASVDTGGGAETIASAVTARPGDVHAFDVSTVVDADGDRESRVRAVLVDDGDVGDIRSRVSIDASGDAHAEARAVAAGDGAANVLRVSESISADGAMAARASAVVVEGGDVTIERTTMNRGADGAVEARVTAVVVDGENVAIRRTKIADGTRTVRSITVSPHAVDITQTSGVVPGSN